MIGSGCCAGLHGLQIGAEGLVQSCRMGWIHAEAGTVSDDFQLEGVFKRDSSQEEAALSQAADHTA